MRRVRSSFSGGGKESTISENMTPMMGNGTPAAIAKQMAAVNMHFDFRSLIDRYKEKYDVLNGLRPSIWRMKSFGIADKSVSQTLDRPGLRVTVSASSCHPLALLTALFAPLLVARVREIEVPDADLRVAWP